MRIALGNHAAGPLARRRGGDVLRSIRDASLLQSRSCPLFPACVASFDLIEWNEGRESPAAR